VSEFLKYGLEEIRIGGHAYRDVLALYIPLDLCR
jgi:hypothetical protein